MEPCKTEKYRIFECSDVTVKMIWTYRGVVNNYIAGSHVAMEDVFFQVLDESALKRQRGSKFVRERHFSLSVVIMCALVAVFFRTQSSSSCSQQRLDPLY